MTQDPDSGSGSDHLVGRRGGRSVDCGRGERRREGTRLQGRALSAIVRLASIVSDSGFGAIRHDKGRRAIQEDGVEREIASIFARLSIHAVR